MLCSLQLSEGSALKVYTVMSQGAFEGNISYAINFFANFRFPGFSSANNNLEALHSASNLPGRVCVITVKLIQDPTCCKEKGTVN